MTRRRTVSRWLALNILLGVSIAWTLRSPTMRRPTSISSATRRSLAQRDMTEQEPLLDELDARVLQSMLQDEKLNLQEEENMKRLLERGIKTKEPVSQEVKRAQKEKSEEENSEYASQVLKKLGNTKLWKGLSRSASDWLESAKIWVENKVERDTKLVTSLGVFAFERALNDVKRALPAASSVVDKVAPKSFMLDSTSSANKDNIRSQMTTPQDEIQSVTNEIKLIIASGGSQRTNSMSRRALQSTATSKQGKDRFLKAYQRRKQTTLRRERENMAQSSARVAGSLMDSAYQVKRELEVEPNSPGYKTKALREGAAQTSRLLASGAKGFLSGARDFAQAALSDGKKNTNELTSVRDGGMAATNAAMDAAMRNAGVKQRATSFNDANVVDASLVDEIPSSTSSSYSVSDAPVNSRIPGNSASAPYFFTSEKKQSRADDTIYADVVGNDEASDVEAFFFASREAPDFLNPNTATLLNQDGTDMDTAYFASQMAREVEPEIMEAIWEPQATSGGGAAPPYRVDTSDVLVDDEEDEDDFLLDEDPEDALRRVMAEIVTDEEFADAFGQAKQVTEVEERDEEENQQSSIWSQLLLRFLDVIFLVLEKVFLALPGLFEAVPRVASRITIIQSQGSGSKGWQTISNAQRGDRRY